MSPALTRNFVLFLTNLRFKRVSEYLKDLAASVDSLACSLVDSPLLNNDQLIFDTPLPTQFISRTPMLKSHDEAGVFFSSLDILVTLPLFHRQLTARLTEENFIWKSHAESQIGSFRRWSKPAVRPSLGISFFQWNITTSSSLDFTTGKTMSRAVHVRNFYIHFSL